jgi:membrane metallo-endopeptidase-like protein 1
MVYTRPSPSSKYFSNLSKISILLQASLPEADRHDTSSIYKKMTVGKLQRQVPQIDWLKYLTTFLELPIDHSETVVTYAMPYFLQMGKIIADTDIR